MPRKPTASAGLKRLLSEDPCQMLYHAVEQVQAQAHYRRVGRVLRHHRRRQDIAGWVHASELTNPCDLAIGAALLGYRPPQQIDAKLQRIFDNGHFMHLRYQNYFLSLPGRFTVTVGQSYYDWPVAGEPDIVVLHPDFGLVVVELKSMNSGRFGLLRAPLLDHLTQVTAYMKLTGAPSAQVWYENKDTQDCRTFCPACTPTDALAYDAALYDFAVARVARIADVVLAGRMPRPCGGADCEWDSYAGELHIDEDRLEALYRAKRGAV